MKPASAPSTQLIQIHAPVENSLRRVMAADSKPITCFVTVSVPGQKNAGVCRNLLRALI